MIYVVDTNIAAAALNLHPAVTAKLAQLSPSDVGFPLIVIGELLFGARNSQRVVENLARVEALRVPAFVALALPHAESPNFCAAVDLHMCSGVPCTALLPILSPRTFQVRLARPFRCTAYPVQVHRLSDLRATRRNRRAWH